MKTQLLIPTVISLTYSFMNIMEIYGKPLLIVLPIIYWLGMILYNIPKWYKALKNKFKWIK